MAFLPIRLVDESGSSDKPPKSAERHFLEVDWCSSDTDFPISKDKPNDKGDVPKHFVWVSENSD